MSKIDKSNYEAYLLDYAEGHLNNADLNELITFITLNSDLGIDLSELSQLPTIQEDIIQSGIQHKLQRSKNDVQNQFDELCLNFYNKEITSEGKRQLDFLLHQFPNLEIDFIAFGHTYLKQQELEEFDNKGILKKQFVGADSFENLAVKAIERTISKPEEGQLKRIIAEDNSYQKEWNAFQNAILVEEIVPFPHKELLYKRASSKNVILLWTARFAVAASILFLFGLFVVDQKPPSNAGLASANIKPIDTIRKATEIPILGVEILKKDTIKNNKTVPRNQSNQVEKASIDISANTYATIDSKSAYSINQFELPSEFIALKPDELQFLTSDEFAMNKIEPTFIKPSQYIWNEVKKVLLKNKIDIDKPIKDVKEDGIAEIGYRSLEKASRGALIIEREINENGVKITGVQFKGIGFTRSAQ